MRNLPTMALTAGIAAASLLFWFGPPPLPAKAPAKAPERVWSTTCTSSYFRNQCGAGDLAAIMGAASDLAFRGRGFEAPVAFVGVRPQNARGETAIVGRRAEAEVVCMTRDAGQARSAAYELAQGAAATLSGRIDRRAGSTLLLTECAWWRA